MNTHHAVSPKKLPDPWHFDSAAVLKELERIRGLILQTPLSNENVLPINTVIDAIWRLESQLRFLIGLHKAGQRAFAQKAQGLSKRDTAAGKRDALTTATIRAHQRHERDRLQHTVMIPPAGKAVSSRA